MLSARHRRPGATFLELASGQRGAHDTMQKKKNFFLMEVNIPSPSIIDAWMQRKIRTNTVLLASTIYTPTGFCQNLAIAAQLRSSGQHANAALSQLHAPHQVHMTIRIGSDPVTDKVTLWASKFFSRTITGYWWPVSAMY
ncbi:hypothetical protein ACI2TD_17770 [Ralstonia nicotianae]